MKIFMLRLLYYIFDNPPPGDRKLGRALVSAIKKAPVNSRDAQRGLKPTLTALKLHRNIKPFDPGHPNFWSGNFEFFTFSTSRTPSTAS